MKKAIQVLLLVAVVVMGYFLIDSPLQKERFDNEMKVRNDAVVERLVAIRTAQESFKNKYGYFTASFDTLVTFLTKDSLPVVKREGILTDSMILAGIDEKAAVQMRLIRRDTSYVPVMNEIFENNVVVDSLRFVPYSGGKMFEIAAGSVSTQANVSVRVCEVKTPYDVYLVGMDAQEITNLKAIAFKLSRYAGLKFGDMSEPNNNAGNWE